MRSLSAPERRPPGNYIPNQMPDITEALSSGRLKVLLLLGTNMLSSFADAARVADGLDKTELLVVCVDLFMNETARRFADVVLPGTAWLEELGCKMTHTHLYLMERALAPPGETRSVYRLVKELAERLGLDGFHPWPSEEAMIDAVLDHPCTGRATVASLRARGGIGALDISHVANPTLEFATPSRKIEFYSAQAERLGLPPLPTHEVPVGPGAGNATVFPLALTQGRTMAHFHGFYNNGRELPTLARRESEPELWLSLADAEARQLTNGAAIRVFNTRGELRARALVTDRIPAGTVWMRDGWPGLNALTGGAPVLPDAAVDLFDFSGGQATFDAMVEVESA